MEAQLRISGDNLIHALDYIKRKKGEEGLNWIVCEIGQGIGDIYPEKMYPLKQFIELLEVIKKNFEEKDSSIISRIGYDRAKTLEFLEYHKKKTDPITLFNLIKQHWSRFFDFGQIEVRNNGDTSVIIYLCDYPANPLYCQCMEGFLNGIIAEICDKKDGIVHEVKCRGKGDRYCKFMVSWA